MKKYLVLTSVLALAACGGGGGGGATGGGNIGILTPTTPTTEHPTLTVQGFDAGTTVNANNTSVTNMSSYTVDYDTSENATKQAMVDYVNDHLGSSRGGLLNRAATRRVASSMGTRDGFTPEQFAAADAALREMKQIVYDMVTKSEESDAALTQYVTQYKNAIIDALKLADQAIDDNASVAEVIAAFTAFKEAKSITSANVLAFGDQLDHDEFGITKTRLDQVRLKDTGNEGFLKFALDEFGQIQSVSLLEDPMGEYGTSWADKRIVINGSGVAEAVAPDATWGLNPFETEYLTDQAGVLRRGGTGTEFTNTVKSYEFTLGKYNEGEGALTLTSGHSASSILQPDDFKKIELISEEALTPETAREKLVHYLIEKVNKKIHNQHGGDVPLDLQDAVEVVNWYINKIDSVMNSSFVSTSSLGDVQQTATMHGMGTTDGVKLKYSDFGYAKLVRNDGVHTPEGNYLTYVGGYDQRRMDDTTANNSLDGATFTGTAIVTVEDHHKNKNTDSETTNTALFRDTNAQLRYNVVADKAQHTLTMDGLTKMDGEATDNSNWYKVVVQGTQDNPTMNITFDAAGKDIDSNYQFFKADSEGNITRNEADSIAAGDRAVNTSGTAANEINMESGSVVATEYTLHGSASAEYYGQDTTNPTEATAGFYVGQHWANEGNTIQHEVSAYGAFGGQKD